MVRASCLCIRAEAGLGISHYPTKLISERSLYFNLYLRFTFSTFTCCILLSSDSDFAILILFSFSFSDTAAYNTNVLKIERCIWRIFFLIIRGLFTRTCAQCYVRKCHVSMQIYQIQSATNSICRALSVESSLFDISFEILKSLSICSSPMYY